MLLGFGAAFFSVTRLITERALALARQQALPVDVSDVYLFSISYGLTFFLFVHFPLMMIIGYRGLRGAIRARKIADDLALCGLDDDEQRIRLREYAEHTGLAAFFLPMLLNGLLLFIVWMIVLFPQGVGGMLDFLGKRPDANLGIAAMYPKLAADATPMTWTLLGVYLYSILVIARRWTQSDLTAAVIWWLDIRIVVALILGLLLNRLVQEAADPALSNLGPWIAALAFLSGMLPDMLLRWLGQQLKRLFRDDDIPLFAAPDLQQKIPGMSFWQADRLAQEGIESIEDLAMQDLGSLLARTHFDSPLLLYWVDRALLCDAAGDDLVYLDRARIVTATQLIAVVSAGGRQRVMAVLEAAHRQHLRQTDGLGGTDAGQARCPLSLARLSNLLVLLQTGPNVRQLLCYAQNAGQRVELPADARTLAVGPLGAGSSAAEPVADSAGSLLADAARSAVQAAVMVEQVSAPASTAAAKATMPGPSSAAGNQSPPVASIAASQQADRLDRSRLPLIALLLTILGLMVVTAHLLAEQAVGPLSHADDSLARFDLYSFAFTYALLFFLLVSLPLLMIIGYRGIKAEVLTDAVQRSLALAGVKEPFLVARMREFRGQQGLWTYILPALVSLGMLFMALSMAMLPQGIAGLVAGIDLNPAAPRLSMGGVLSHAISQTSPHVWTVLGAYFQGILMLLQSWLRSEFTNESIWRFNVRLLNAFVIGLLILALFNVTGQDLDAATPMLSAFAFFAGMVPEQAMRWIARRLQSMGAVDAEAVGIFAAPDLPRHIPGITLWQQDRLSADGIESVQDLAFQDIPEMLMRNRLDGKLLMRWVDRALLCAQAGDAADRFRLAHIDTATALAVAMGGKADGSQGLQALQDADPGLDDGRHASTEQASMESAPIAPELVQSIAAGLDQTPILRYLQAFARNVGMPGDCSTGESADSGFASGFNPVLPESVRRQDMQSPGTTGSRPELSAHSQEPSPMSNYRVIVDALELRAGPGTNYEILEQLANGTELEQVPPSPHWTKVRRVSDGRIGWVYNAYIRPTQPEPESAPVAAATPAASPAVVSAASPAASPAIVPAASPPSSPAASPSMIPASSPASSPVSGLEPSATPTTPAGKAIPAADTAEPVLNDAAGADLAFDISHFQPNVDFHAAYAGGLRAVFHKATEGIYYVDPRYASARAQAAAAGLLWGAYHFGTGDDALAQAEHFLSIAKPDGKTLLALDLERNPQGPSMSIEQARTFVSHLQQVTGKWPGLYSGSYIRDNLGNAKDPVLSNCWFWLAEYGPVAHAPPTWGQWAFWQHTNGHVGPGPQSVPGCGPCDRDRFAGDAEALAAFWRANA